MRSALASPTSSVLEDSTPLQPERGRKWVECIELQNDCLDPLPECPTDIDGNGTTDIMDLLEVIAWDQSGPPRPVGDCAPGSHR